MDAATESGKRERELGIRFFSGAMTEAERPLLDEAYDLDGLDHEIAILRVKLRTAIEKHPDNLRLMLMVMNTLVRLAAVRYRISPKVKQDLADNLAAVLNSLGDLILPPD